MRYVLAPRVKQDLEEIADWIAEEDPRRALKVIRGLKAAFGRIAENPMHYQLRPEVGDEARLVAVGHHVVMFWIDGDVVRFERVVYGGRELTTLFPHMPKLGESVESEDLA